MNNIFEGKRALVTGCGQGIGRAVALELANLGAEVYGFSKTAEKLQNLKAENDSIHITTVDLRDWDTARKAVESILPIHLLVNNAGRIVRASCFEATEEDYHTLFDTNVKSVLNITQVITSDLIKRGLKGCVVNISSVSGHYGQVNRVLYASSKAALNMMTKCFALELAPHGIRINAVSPTLVRNTGMADDITNNSEKMAAAVANIPQGRIAEIHEVVDAVIYLLSDKSSMINGHALPIDGGRLANC